MVGTGPHFLLCHLCLRVDLGAVLPVRGNIQQAVAHENAVDCLGFCLERRRHHGVLAPAGGQQQAGHHAQGGVDVPYQFHARFLACQGVHAAHHVRTGHTGGVQALGRHRQRGGLLCRLGQNGDQHVSVIVMGGNIVTVSFQGGVPVLDLQGVQQDIGLFINHLAVRHGAVLRLVHLGVRGLFGVQHVHQDNGGDIEHAETGVNALAQGKVLEVVGIPHILLALRERVAQHGLVYRRRRIFGQVNGGGPENHLQARAALNGGGQACVDLRIINAMEIRHFPFPPLAVPLGLAVQGVIASGPVVELAPDLRQLVQGDHQAAQDRLFLDGLRQRGRRSVCVNGVLHGHAGDGGAAVDHRASGLVCLFGVFAHVSGTSLKMAGAANVSAMPAK